MELFNINESTDFSVDIMINSFYKNICGNLVKSGVYIV